MHKRRGYSLLAATGAVTAMLISVLTALPASANTTSLTRYPYLTDVVNAGSTDNATVNWATDTSQTTGYATYGLAGTESCTAHRANGSKTAMTVNGVAEEQWKAKITGLTPGASYCYRVFFSNPTVDLLATDTSPVFPVPGTSGSFKFAVFGDWGDTVAPGDQANLDAQIAASGAQFLLGAGDTAYNSGSQANYGDLYQTGSQISDVFGPNLLQEHRESHPAVQCAGQPRADHYLPERVAHADGPVAVRRSLPDGYVLLRQWHDQSQPAERVVRLHGGQFPVLYSRRHLA